MTGEPFEAFFGQKKLDFMSSFFVSFNGIEGVDFSTNIIQYFNNNEN
jgi:hypothetical protein